MNRGVSCQAARSSQMICWSAARGEPPVTTGKIGSFSKISTSCARPSTSLLAAVPEAFGGLGLAPRDLPRAAPVGEALPTNRPRHQRAPRQRGRSGRCPAAHRTPAAPDDALRPADEHDRPALNPEPVRRIAGDNGKLLGLEGIVNLAARGMLVVSVARRLGSEGPLLAYCAAPL
jgi:hypothetical protein